MAKTIIVLMIISLAARAQTPTAQKADEKTKTPVIVVPTNSTRSIIRGMAGPGAKLFMPQSGTEVIYRSPDAPLFAWDPKQEAQAAWVQPRYCVGLEQALHDACVQSYIKGYQYEANVFNQNKAIYDFELISTKVILGMVLLLVSSGLIFATLQFWHALYGMPAPGATIAAVIAANKLGGPEGPVVPQPAPSAPADPDSPPSAAPKSDAELASDIEISLTSLKIKSSVLGLLLIVVSMGFFYLYLRYVYPIQEVTTTQAPADLNAPK